MRPADRLYPDRLEAIRNNRCLNPPIGCGKKLEAEPFHSNFEDLLSLKEYNISALCQKCQNEIFIEDEEDGCPNDLD